jgi:hypothetical protein
MVEFILENKKWIFSGVGVAIIGGLLGILFHKRKKQNIKAGHSSTNIQTGNGSTISISTNSKEGDNLIQRASLEDVKKYDHKTIKLLKTIEKREPRFQTSDDFINVNWHPLRIKLLSSMKYFLIGIVILIICGLFFSLEEFRLIPSLISLFLYFLD